MLELLLAAALQLPQATQATAKRLFNKTPEVTEKTISAAKVDLWIAPDGEAKDCKIVRFFGDQRIAERLCKAAVGAKFEPARDENGIPVHSLLTSTLSAYPDGFQFRVDQMKKRLEPTRQSLGLSVQLSELPPELTYDARVSLTIKIDRLGDLSACESSDGVETKWSKIACAQAALIDYEQRGTDDGEPVPYLSSIMVVFESSQ